MTDVSDKKFRYDFLKKDFLQGFPAFCGFKVEKIEYGTFYSRLRVQPNHQQQDGFVHAGVLATMADHTAGYSAYTVVPDNFRILTVEFKINFLKPTTGNTIICKSNVIKKGQKIIVSESEIVSVSGKKEENVSKAMVTMMAVSL